jgi:hypothetical protein
MVAVAAVSLARQSGLPATRTVWAEDGTLFYAQGLQSSAWHSLWIPYNGYEQLLPRLLTLVALRFPVAQASAVIAVCGAASLGAMSACVFHMARGHIAHPLPRAMLAASMVLLPVATGELLDNMVNAPWWLFFTAFWALLWRPQTRPGRALAVAIGFLAVASEPLVLLFAPLALLRGLALRSWREQAPTLGYALGLAYQLVARIGVKEAAFSPSNLDGVPRTVLAKVDLGLVTGARATQWLDAHDAGVAMALGAVVLVGVLALGLASAPSRVFALVAAVYSVVCLAVPGYLRGVSAEMATADISYGSRYLAVPLLLMASAVFVAGGHAMASRPVPAHGRRRPPGARAWAPVLLALAFLPAWVADFRDANARTAGPDWTAQVTTVTEACRRGAPYGAFEIDPPGWTAVVPCTRLLGER